MKEESDDLSGMAGSHSSFEEILAHPGSPSSQPFGSPSALDPSSPLSFPSINIPSYALPNAVHMEVQENAKLPTFNLPVDRSNSTSRNRSASLGYDPATATAIDEMVRLSENDINLTELFLTSDKRSNASIAYSGANDLQSSPGEKERSFSLGSHGFNELLDMKSPPGSPTATSLLSPSGLTAAIPTTPGGSKNEPADTSSTPAELKSHFPQGRKYPLPIPTKVSSPPTTSLPIPDKKSPEPITSPTRGVGGDPLAVAISTAAAIASRRNNTNDPLPVVPSAVSVLNKAGVPSGSAQPATQSAGASTPKVNGANKLPSKTASTTGVKAPSPPTSSTTISNAASSKQATTKNAIAPTLPGTPTSRAPAPSSAFYKRQARPAQASHAAAHATSPASIQDATKRRSQFGFGGNHVVPSVPLPPPKPRAPKKGGRSKQTIAVPLPPSRAAVVGANAGAAYERKKQRAKDARVKLNDSIERLSIAINLVGTQSKQRAAQMKGIDFNSTDDSSRKLADFGRAAHQIMNDCEAMAKAAKKWDRPSFVGTAASLLQGLNSQCDAIMRVVMEMNNHMELQRKESGRVEGKIANVVPVLNGDLNNSSHLLAKEEPKNDLAIAAGKVTDVFQGQAKHGLFDDAKSASVSAKRQKTNTGEGIPTIVRDTSSVSEMEGQHETQAGPFSDPSVVKSISMFLDPRSLCRCRMVSKEWNSRKLFRNEEAWHHLAVSRYGVVAVRQWEQDKADDYAVPISTAALFKIMDRANVKPHCLQDGNVFLGGGRIQGVASAWVSLVERSNCETARSVKRSEDSNGVGQYTSLPVVELRILIQNTGVTGEGLVIKEQVMAVDASTRRRGEEFMEIQTDCRFKKTVLNVDGTDYVTTQGSDQNDLVGDLCRLHLFESVLLVAHVHARGCATTSKFKAKANFTKVLVTVSGTAIPLVVPFGRGEAS